MDIQTFVKTYTGKAVGDGGRYTGQCVMLFWRFNLDCGKGESYSAAGAWNLWQQGGQAYIWDTYHRITGTLIYGDWVIWSGAAGAYQNDGAGHVAMFLSDNGNGTAQFFTQNPGPARIMTLSLSGVVGALRSKTAQAAAPKPAAPAGVAVLRTVGPNGAHYRAAPNTGGRILQTFTPGAKTYWRGYVVGQDPYGTGDNAWLVGAYTGQYAWASGFTPDSIAGLPRL